MNVKEKLQKLVNTHGEIVEKEGNSHISTCNHYNWDQDVWK